MQINSQTIQNINSLTYDEKIELLKQLDELQKAKFREDCKGDFITFVKAMWPAFIEGDHHKIMAEEFGRVVNGDLKRLIINMPPRHTKSEFAS